MTDQSNNKREKENEEMESWFKDFVDHACDLVQCVDSEGRFVFVNQAWLTKLGYSTEEIYNITLWDIIHPDSMEHCMAVFNQVITGKAYGEVEAIFVAKDGTPVLVEGNVNVKLDENSRFLHTRGIFRDVTERKRMENVNRLLFDISNAVVTVQSLDDLYQSIHTALGRVMDVTNFFIAIVDMQKRTLYFPYHVDTEDNDFLPITDFNPVGSLTGLVVSKRQPVLYKKEELDERAQKGGVWGPVPQIWMGTPLMIEDEVIGIVAVQSYTDQDLYSEEDLRILSAVSDQMASAIARKRAEEELLALKNFNERIIQAIQEGIIISDLNGTVTFANPALLKVLGYSAEELIGSHWTYIVPPQYHALVEAADARRLEDKTDRYELLLKHKNGALLPFQVSGSPYYNYATGEIDGTMAVLTDITERKRIEEALKQSEEQYRTLNENIPISIYRSTPGPEGHILIANPGFMQTFGIKSKEELAQLKVIDLYQEPAERAEFFERLIAKGQLKGFELRLKRLDGTTIWGSVTARVVYNKSGEIAWVDGIIEDITERKQAEELLDVQNAILRTQQEVSPDGIFIVDENEKIISYNQKFCDIWGIPEEILADEMRQKALDYVLPKLNDPEEFARRIYELYDNRQERSYEEISLKDGRMLERYSAPMFGDEGQYYGRVWYYRDITERKQAEEALKQSEEQYRTLNENIPIGIYRNTPGPEGRFLMANPAFLNILGIAGEEELRDLKVSDLYVNPPDRKAFSDQLLKKNKLTGVELRLKKLDGTPIWASVTAHVVRDENNKVKYFDCALEDITKRKQAEEVLLEERAFRGILLDLAAGFINVPLAEFDRAINDMLGKIGEFTSLDRVYLFLHDHLRRVTSNTHEWCREGVTPEIDNLQETPFDFFLDFLEAWEKGEIVHIPSVAQMPKEHAMRSILLEQSIQSLLLIPLMQDKVNIGFVGFDAVNECRTFSDQEIALLRVLAEIISNAFAHKAAEEQVRKSEERFNQLAEHSRTITWEVNADGLYTYVSHVATAVIGYRPEELVGRMHFYELHPEEGREAFKSAAFEVIARKEPFENLVNAVLSKTGETH